MTTLRLLPSDIKLPVHPGESITEAICRNGFTYRYGCRRGGCAACKADLVSGEVTYRSVIADSVLSAQERVDGVVLTCRAHVVSDEVVVRIREANGLKLNVPLLFAAAQRELAIQADIPKEQVAKQTSIKEAAQCQSTGSVTCTHESPI